jgi:hypothetical protein
MLVKLTGRPLTFVTVAVCGGLVDPIGSRPKSSLLAENVSVSGVYTSASLVTTQQMVCGVIPPLSSARPVLCSVM